MSRLSRHAATFCLWLFLLLLGACTALGPTPDPELGRQHRTRAEQLIRAHDYQAAAEELAAAVTNLPGDNDTVLRYGEILEALDRSQEAVRVYSRALDNQGGEKEALSYRLALLQALQFNRLKEALRLHADLPQDSFEARDLNAVITLRQGQPRQALIALSALAREVQTEDQAGYVTYHAALAYRAMGADGDSSRSLYQAINHAENLGLVRRIKREWESRTPAATGQNRNGG